MHTLTNLFAVLATLFLLLAAWGLFHQAYLCLKVGSTEAVSPIRYGGTLLANVVWVLISVSTPIANLPLLLGCGAMMFGSTVVLFQIYLCPPQRSKIIRTGILSAVVISFIVTIVGVLFRTHLNSVAPILGIVGVISSFFMIHLGTLDQIRINRKRGSVKGLSLPKEVLHLCDWGTWIIYPALLGLGEHWAPFANACFGFVFTIFILQQFSKYREAPREGVISKDAE